MILQRSALSPRLAPAPAFAVARPTATVARSKQALASCAAALGRVSVPFSLGWSQQWVVACGATFCRDGLVLSFFLGACFCFGRAV